MAKVRDILQALERAAPTRFAFDYDKVGLQVGDESQDVRRAVVSLDRSLAAVECCIEKGAEMLVAHHPLIFRPLDTVTTRSHVGRTILKLAAHNIAFAAAHTNWDAARSGVNDRLAEILGLRELREFGAAAGVEQVKLVFFCPSEAANEVIDACSEVGAGHIGLYRRCAFMNPGTGSFLGEEGSRPAIGVAGEIEEVEEMRVEMVLPPSRQQAVVNAIRRTHPYEEPAFDLYPLAPKAEMRIGRIGDLETPVPLSRFAQAVDAALDSQGMAWGDPHQTVNAVAVVGGAACDEWRSAQNAGADVLVTGEVKQHNALEAAESGFALIAAGHYATEQPGAEALKNRLAGELPEIEWICFAPPKGFAGRPL